MAIADISLTPSQVAALRQFDRKNPTAGERACSQEEIDFLIEHRFIGRSVETGQLILAHNGQVWLHWNT